MSGVEFGSLFEFIRNGMSVKQDKSGDGLPISRIETISEGIVDLERVGFAGLLESECSDWILQDGDLLFSHINSVEHIGKCAVYRQRPSKLVHGMNLLCLRPKKDQLDSTYAKYLIRSQGFRGKLASYINKAVNQASVSIGNIRTISVSVPPLPEQRRIAAILDQAETLRAKRRAALAKIDTLAQSIFIGMFGDPATNPKGWDMVPLGQIGSVVTGSTPPRAKTEYYGTAIEWIKSDNLNTPSYFLTKADEGLSEAGKRVARIAPLGSILVTCIAGSPACIGNAAIADREVAFNQQINAVIPIRADTQFLFSQIIVGKRLIQEASTASMKGMVNKSRFEEIQFILPPRPLQETFSKTFDQIQGLKSHQEKQLSHLDALFASLQHRAFRGEL